jgi:hypothetical protein
VTTSTTQGFLALCRGRALDYVPPTTTTLRTLLGGGASARLYTEQAPDIVTYPYAVLSWKSVSQTEGYQGWRMYGELEFQVWDRPRGNEWRAQGIADVIQQAFLGWSDSASGLSFGRHSRRQRVPLAAEPSDRELVRILVFVPVAAWPVLLSPLTV